MKRIVVTVTFCSLLALAAVPAAAQTFEIGGKETNQPRPGAAPKGKKGKAAQAGASGIGWGASIEVGRMARAAEDALRRGNYGAAANFAQRAVQAAPQNGKLWFLYGYTSRLAGRYQQSLDAYRRGLQSEPGSPEGLSGMAQTLARMGQMDEAKRLLMQVINANPKRVNDILIAGELYMRSGDLQQAINLLERAEAVKPSAHSEVLMATAYLRLKQPARAKELLDRAKRRDPRNTAVFRAVANYQREVRDYAAAIQTLKSAPRMNGDLLADLAYTYELAGNKKESAATYARAAHTAPRNISFQLSAAQAHLHIGDPEEARQFMARAAAIEPEHYRLHALRALMAKNENRTDDAIREYNLALSRLPQGAVPEGQLYPIQLRLNLSELYKQTDNDAAARQQMALAEEAINRIQVEGPAKAEFLRVRASIRSSSNDVAGAEADLKQALALDPNNTNIHLQYANLLWRSGRKPDARKIYAGVLGKDAKNRFALEGLGHLAREDGDLKGAEEFFNRLATAHPDDYVAHLALGDLYTATRDFARAEDSYQKAFQLAPKNAVIVANGANAAIEARNFDLAGQWVARAQGAMDDDPRLMRERERWLFHTGKYLESAQLGEKVLEKLPKDRNASVYLGYALYNLGRFDDVLALSNRYEHILQKEPNFPLLAGHVHKQSQLLQYSVDDYGRAIERDPRMVEAYVNRGYVLNDLQNPEPAIADFNTALKLNPNNGIAHLGMAFSHLQLRRGKVALDHVDQAERLMGESGATHLARATAFRQQRLLDKAEKEYRVALKYAPKDLKLNLALADTLYHLRRYAEAVDVLNAVLHLAPDDPFIYAKLAHAQAHLGNRSETFRDIQLAEQTGSDQSAVLLATGGALMVLGDTDAAMERFERALDAPDANRVDARMAIARLFLREGKWDDARQQISLAFAESRIGEATPVTADNFVEAANILLAMQDFDLAVRYFEKAQKAGAGEQAVAIGLANAYLAQGDTPNAQATLASLGNPADYQHNYEYQLAMGSMYRQRRDPQRALTAFAHANMLSPNDDLAERLLQETAAEEGWQINRNWSVGSNFSAAGIFENSTIYEMDAKLFGVTNPDFLPPPRASTEYILTSSYRYHNPALPVVSGFFQVRNARGQTSLPSEALVLDRNTYDYSFNSALNPVLHIGRDTIAFNTGVQFTLRRDRQAPVAMNQNLFRQFVYMSTSSFFNWIVVRGSAYRESGPFSLRELNSRDLGARIEFVVGRPWGKMALVTGYSVRDLTFSPLVREYFTTSSYAGIQRRFLDNRLTVSVLGEYIRSWRVQERLFATAQAMRPAAEFEYRASNRWSFSGSFAVTRGQGFHEYDNMQSGFFISYVKPWRRMMQDGAESVPVEYPLRFSFGIQTQSFGNFAGRGQAQIRPVIRLTLF